MTLIYAKFDADLINISEVASRKTKWPRFFDLPGIVTIGLECPMCSIERWHFHAHLHVIWDRLPQEPINKAVKSFRHTMTENTHKGWWWTIRAHKVTVKHQTKCCFSNAVLLCFGANVFSARKSIWRPSAILNLQNFGILLSSRPRKHNLHLHTKFHWNRIICGWDIVIKLFSKWRPPPSWIFEIRYIGHMACVRTWFCFILVIPLMLR